MTSPAAVPPLDYNHMAAEFDRFLPQIHPVTLALLDHLPPPAAGATVLDVACGTGEPGLTLARRRPDIQLRGVDSAEGMIAVAQGKAAREALPNARFALMSSDALTLDDASVDGVLSRFGLLMFGDVPGSARELARVLRPGGHFSLAVWDDMARNTLVNAGLQVLRAHLPKDHRSPLEPLQAWAGEERRAGLLLEVGLQVRTALFEWTYRFDSFEGAWDLWSRLASFTGQGGLPQEAQAQVKGELAAVLSGYREAEGAYVIPHACRLLWGQR